MCRKQEGVRGGGGLFFFSFFPFFFCTHDFQRSGRPAVSAAHSWSSTAGIPHTKKQPSPGVFANKAFLGASPDVYLGRGSPPISSSKLQSTPCDASTEPPCRLWPTGPS